MAEVTVQECEDYVQKHQIQPLLKTAIETLCKERPDNPIKYLKEYFERLDKEKVSGLRNSGCLEALTTVLFGLEWLSRDG